jgi:endonuclease YncB( thermonuclease family)
VIVALALGACTDWFGAGGGDSGADTGPSADDSPDTAGSATDLAADDARVRALTDLPEGASTCREPLLARVAYISDGDTVYVHPVDGSEGEKVRFIGVDTPEIAHEGPAECYGEEANAFTSEQLLGRLAWLTFDAECFDPYDRTLAYVIRGEGETGFFNRVLARQGYATALQIEPDVTYADEIEADVAAAEREHLGMWESCR